MAGKPSTSWSILIIITVIAAECTSLSTQNTHKHHVRNRSFVRSVVFATAGCGSVIHSRHDRVGPLRYGKSHDEKSTVFSRNTNRSTIRGCLQARRELQSDADDIVPLLPVWVDYTLISKSVVSALVIALSLIGAPASSQAFGASMHLQTMAATHQYDIKASFLLPVPIMTVTAEVPETMPPSQVVKIPTLTIQKSDSTKSNEGTSAKTDTTKSKTIVQPKGKENSLEKKVNSDKLQQSSAPKSSENTSTAKSSGVVTREKSPQAKNMSTSVDKSKQQYHPQSQPQLKANPSKQSIAKQPRTSSKSELQPIDIKKVAEQNTIDVELICKDDDERPIPVRSQSAVVKIDRNTFQKIKVSQPSFFQWLPPSLQPRFQSMQVLKSIPNDQLFFASVVAGSLTEIIRTTLLYPLGTVKARVQARTLRSTNRKRPLLRKLKVTWLTFLYETKRGDWYAGIVPSLLISIPASGIYSGVKDVSKRLFTMAAPVQSFSYLFHGDIATASYYSALSGNLLAAFFADLASVAIRTPADVLALRLQVFGKTNVKSDLSDWAKDSVALLPSMLVCDLPYLLSRIFLNAAITTSGENLGQYEVETISIACLCAFLTTPFDVARTRILLPTLPSEEVEEIEGRFGETEGQRRRRLIASSKYREQRRQKLSVLITLRRISAEGNGGLQNLFSGWVERTVFLGLGRAWLDPLRVIGYLGIRDSILLKLFD